MPIHEDPSLDNYIDSQDRAERMQLIVHLLRNAPGVPYLRGQQGVGKTWFSRKLSDVVKNEFTVIWLRGGVIHDVAVQVCEQLRLPVHLASSWPESVLRVSNSKRTLLVIDGANALGQNTMDALYQFRRQGGAILLVGNGQGLEFGNHLPIDYVDLPALSKVPDSPSPEPLPVNSYRSVTEATRKNPIPSVQELPGQPYQAMRPEPAAMSAPFYASISSTTWLAGGAIVALLLALLIFGDDVNEAFEPTESPSVAKLSVPVLPEEPLDIEPPPAELNLIPVIPPQAEAPSVAQSIHADVVTDSVSKHIKKIERDIVAKPTEAISLVPELREPVIQKPQKRTLPFTARERQREWLMSRTPNGYTLQLVGARDVKSLQRFMEQNGVKPPFGIFERNLAGTPWYSLVAGEYDSREAAIRARENLPWRLKAEGVWPRQFSSIQEVINAK